MRVLFVHERLGALGGAEANILHTARELKRRGHTLGIVHGPPTGQGEAAWTETFAQRFPLADERNGARVAAAVEVFAPDAVYVHKTADLELLEALVKSSAPVVRMVHDHDLYCMRSYKYHYFTRRPCARAASAYCVAPCGAFVARNHGGGLPVKWVSYAAKREELRLNKRFDQFVVASRFMTEELVRNGFSEEQIEIHPPVPVSGEPEWRSSFSERNVLIYAGQIIRGKGVDVLLESLAKVRAPFECFIFGEGNHREACEGMSRKLGLAARVRFMGYVPPAAINDFYRDASVMLMSSVWPEPFGAAGLEAMRFGLPVVAFDAGAIREWLANGENGFLVPWMDRAAYARRIDELLGDKSLARRMGERGRVMVAERYEFSRYIDGLEHLLARVAGKGRETEAA